MKPCYRLALASLLALFISACSQPAELSTPELEPQYGTTATDIATHVTVNANGAVYTLGLERKGFAEDTEGEYKSGTTSTLAVLSRFNRSGARVWTRKVDLNCAYSATSGSLPCYGEFFGLETDTAGNAYLYVSTIVQGPNKNVSSRLLKYSPSGVGLWERTIPFRRAKQLELTDYLAGLGTNAEGQSYVAFRAVQTDRTGQDAEVTRLRKYDVNGRMLWERPLSIASPNDVAISGSGNVYVVGEEGLAKYGAGGALVWTKSAAGGTSVAVSGSNTIYIQGLLSERIPNSDHEFDTYPTLSKYDASGKQVWRRRGKQNTYFFDVSADSSGNAYLSGGITTEAEEDSYPTYEYDYLIQKYTSSGSAAWTSTAKLLNTSETAYGVVAYSSNEIYAVGDIVLHPLEATESDIDLSMEG